MNLRQLAKLWTVVGAVLAYYALNSWLVSQGGNEIFGVKLVHSGRIPAAMLAIVVCSGLLVAVSLIGLVYANRATPLWHERIPVVAFEAIDTGSREGKAYQLAMMIIVSMLPALSLIHFWLVLISGKVVTTGRDPHLASGIWDSSALRGFDDPARICTGLKVQSPVECDNGVTFFPLIEPLILAILTIISVLALAFHWRSVFCHNIKTTHDIF